MAEVLVTRPLPESVIDKLGAAHNVTLRESIEPLDREELICALSGFDAVLPTLGDAFTAEVFEAADDIRCRLLANFGVGYNHIDVEAARAHGVEVSNTPGAVTDATADIALTLLLMTARRAGEGERFVRAGKWTGWDPMQLLGTHVTGKTLGVIGMGRIGQAIARRCHFGFDMSVEFYNRSPKRLDFPARQRDDIADVAALADFLVIAVPGGAETHHLIDASVFANMSESAIFVNISRGDVVDEPALIAALEAGEIAGAGLDVYENEPHVPEALRRMENVSLLPHLGTAAFEVREAMGLLAADNILSFFETGEVPNRV
ncbi:MAG: 2-hydroxyacid dehydrogenase [Maritimibacter harenae]